MGGKTRRIFLPFHVNNREVMEISQIQHIVDPVVGGVEFPEVDEEVQTVEL